MPIFGDIDFSPMEAGNIMNFGVPQIKNMFFW